MQANQIKAKIDVSFIPDFAIPIAVYCRANGGVMPSKAPVIQGSIAATNKGFTPTPARL